MKIGENVTEKAERSEKEGMREGRKGPEGGHCRLDGDKMR